MSKKGKSASILGQNQNRGLLYSVGAFLVENLSRIVCFVLFVLILLCSSCDFLQRELQSPREYRLQAPSVAEDWLSQNELHVQGWLWLVDYIETDYESGNYSLVQKRYYGPSVTVHLKKQASAVALVYPIFAEFAGLSDQWHLLWRPGAVDVLWQEHSDDVGSYKLRATWRGGFRGFVLHELLAGGFDIRYFNSQKLQLYLDLRIGSGSVWGYDAPYLISEIAKLEVDWYDIRKRETVRIFALPSASGFWQPLNVIDGAWRCQALAQANCSPELAFGRHYFWDLDRMQLWELEVLASGEVLSVLLLDLSLPLP